jgi:O-antigen ligase
MWLFGLLGIAVLLSALFNRHTATWYAYFTLAINGLTVVLVYNALAETRDIPTIFAGMVGLGQVVGFTALMTANLAYRLDNANLSGLGGANSLALLFALCLPFAGYFVLSKGPVLVRLWGVISFGFVLAGLVWTASRGAAVGALFGLIVFWLAARVKIRLLVLVLVVVSIIVLTLPPDSLEYTWLHYANATRGSQTSVEERLFIVDVGSRLFLESPIFGYGLGRGRYEIVQAAPWAFRGHDKSLHNVYLEIGLDLGLVGLVAFTGLIGLSLWSVLRMAIVRPRSVIGTDPRLVAGVLLAAGCVLAVSSLAQANFSNRAWYLTIGLLLASGNVL